MVHIRVDSIMTDFAAIAAEFGDDPDAPPQGAGFMHTGPIWRWQAARGETPTAWFFLTLDGDTAQAIRASAGPRRGFGSIRVKARIGGTDFETSIFPSKETGGFILPLKASVRKKERLNEGDIAEVELTLA